MLDEIETEEEGEDEGGGAVTEAEYGVNVRLQRMRNGSLVLRQLEGMCDTDLTNADINGHAIFDPGVPPVAAGDVATAILVDPSETLLNPSARTFDKDFLQGTFVVAH